MPRQGRSSSTDEVFAALANPTRRSVLDLLLGGPLSASDVAAHFDMARPSVSEHLRVLRVAGLVKEERSGRLRVYAVAAEPLAMLRDWLTPYEQFWRGALSELSDYLDGEAE